VSIEGPRAGGQVYNKAESMTFSREIFANLNVTLVSAKGKIIATLSAPLGTSSNQLYLL
jgi:hypothetical protein